MLPTRGLRLRKRGLGLGSGRAYRLAHFVEVGKSLEDKQVYAGFLQLRHLFAEGSAGSFGSQPP